MKARKTRSASGAGGIRRRSDGRFEARYSVEVAGRMERRSIFGTTSAEVRSKLRSALTNRDSGLVSNVTARDTTGEYLDDWITSAASTIRPRTLASYRGVIRLYIQPALGRVPLLKLQPTHVSRMYADMLARGLSPKTVRNTGLVLHRAMEQARRWGLLPINVCSLVDLPRRVRPEMSALTADEARRVREVAREDNLEALWVVLLTCGIRQGEAVGLQWSAVDLKAGKLRVVASMIRLGGEDPRLDETKTHKSMRTIDLSADAIDALQRHRARQAANVIRPLTRDGFVFQRDDGRPLSFTTMWKLWRRLLLKSGVRPLGVHAARHTTATLLLERGVDAKTVSEMLGHSSVAFTLDVYGHVTARMSKQAANVMDDLFTGTA
jgi:integrase